MDECREKDSGEKKIEIKGNIEKDVKIAIERMRETGTQRRSVKGVGGGGETKEETRNEVIRRGRGVKER